MSDEMMRADAALTARGLVSSREKARALIEAGLAAVNGAVIAKPSRKVGAGDVLTVLGEPHPYVSRGGLKLEKALRVFDVDATGLACVDVGASTGGFTDVLLRSGARRVYAVDVGTGQLDPKLQSDPRVVSLEHVNARTLSAAMFPEPLQLAVMDVSFISIRLILPALFQTLGAAGQIITLVKPQFEAGKRDVGKRGIVSKPEVHRRVLREIAAFPREYGWRVRAMDVSPITGGDGNTEFLADLLPAERCDREIAPEEIERLVK